MHCTGLFLLLGLCAFWAELAPASGQRPPAAHGLSAAGVPKRCQLKPETGPCKARLTRYYYDHPRRSCWPFVYGGCGGNSNNFLTEAECMRACAYPRKGAV
uniref:Uncharacterized protein n=1 Tax=Sphaerodactylus townsendi TaxID=933632 RepID=A0ACB8F6S6_9SAUR